MIPTLCKECYSICTSLNHCLRNQEFNLIVENAKAINKLKKHIKATVPHFKGAKSIWLHKEDIINEYDQLPFLPETVYKYRFLTITFDPRKFSFNELTQPKLLINYALNALFDLRNLFKGKPIIIIEYHKSGIPHFHINYDVEGQLELSTLILRLKYFFSENLRNKICIHDRVFNEYGKNYMRKSNETYFTFKT